MNSDIKATLRERGLKQRDIATQLGVSEATVSQWFSALRDGKHQRIPAEKARPLARALGVEPTVIRPDLWPQPEDAAPQAEAA